MEHCLLFIRCSKHWTLVDTAKLCLPLSGYWCEGYINRRGWRVRRGEGGGGWVPCGSMQRQAVECETGVPGMGEWTRLHLLDKKVG